ncbi:DNA helicase [Trifolium repens]|nr:DNA helicase [Trifolium repens]
MPSLRRRIQSNTRGCFLTAYIIGQPYGEINPKFIHEYAQDMDEQVILMDRSNRRMSVQFNGSTQNPYFVYGWSNVGPHFGYNENKMIRMSYLGNSRFVLDFLPQHFNPSNLPNYHSYKQTHSNPVSFDVKLTQYLATGSQLTLRKDFATYIRATTFNNVTLIGPQGDEVECKLLLRTIGQMQTTKIGEGWKEFIEINGFVAGDTLNFKFVNKLRDNVIKVIQL